MLKKVDDKERLEPCECGIGDLRLTYLDVDGTKKHRLLLRQERTNKRLLNVLVHKQIKLSRENTTLRFGTYDGDGKLLNYLIKLKDKAEAQALIKKIEEVAGLPPSPAVDN
jgi:hypothetical protein